jgi:hypothetical protein
MSPSSYAKIKPVEVSKTMRTTVNLPDPVLHNAKRAAEERGLTLSGILEEALRVYLARKPETAAPAFKLHTVRGRLANPNLDLNRTSQLDVNEDESRF